MDTQPKQDTKVCKACGQDLPLADFSLQRRDIPSGYRSNKCTACDALISKARYRSSFHARFGYLLAAAKHRASKKYNIPCSLTVADLESIYKEQAGLCFYSGEPLSLETGNTAVSIDRLDPSGPYNKDNIALVCWLVNSMKRQQSHAEFIQLCGQIADRHR
jgi:hypothetical protein